VRTSASRPNSLARPIILVPMLVFTLLLGVWFRLISAGMEMMLLAVPMLLCVFIHLAVHVGALLKWRGQGAPYARRILFSHFLFLCAFGLQPGVGDSPGVYVGILTAYGLVTGSGRWHLYLSRLDFDTAMLIDLVLLAGLVASWVMVGLMPRVPQTEAAALIERPDAGERSREP
jgi:hypothetical protein